MTTPKENTTAMLKRIAEEMGLDATDIDNRVRYMLPVPGIFAINCGHDPMKFLVHLAHVALLMYSFDSAFKAVELDDENYNDDDVNEVVERIGFEIANTSAKLMRAAGVEDLAHYGASVDPETGKITEFKS